MTRPPVLRAFLDDDQEIFGDLFAGGGGASEGAEEAIGQPVTFAVNHDQEALGMHAVNHPRTKHYCCDVFEVDPAEVCQGRPVGGIWFSPDCTYHSKARGSKPFRDPKQARGRRGLAWVVIRWARRVKPRVIFLENVEEFEDWGPLKGDKPDPERKGLVFRIWLGKLKAAGYHVEYRQLRACDYGAPTTRKRLFLIARSDGQPIVWPDPTHGRTTGVPYRTAAECIDWSLPCPSIFGRKKPLVEKTMARIARGVWKYVIGNAEPFIVPVTHGGDHRVHSIREPLRTVTAAQRGELALIGATMVQTGYGERRGQAPRTLRIDQPLGTVVGSQKHALVAAFLAKHYGGHEGSGAPLTLPLSTVTTQDHHAVATAVLTKNGDRRAEVRAFLTKYNGTGVGQSLQLPLGTVTTKDRFGLVVVHGETYEIADIGQRMLTPRELFRAQGFPGDYIIDRGADGAPLTLTAQVRMCGNSVSPPVAAAIVRANMRRGARRAA